MAATVTEGNTSGLKRLARAAGRDFVAGVVVYDGDACLPFGDRQYAEWFGVTGSALSG